MAIVPYCGPAETRLIGDKLRALVEQSSIRKDSEIVRVTVSIGATTARPEDSMKTIITRADKLMYSSKINGRNRVTADISAE